MLLILCAKEIMGCSKTSAGLEVKPQKFCLWFRQLFKASKAAAREKGKQMYLETTYYSWYYVGAGEQSMVCSQERKYALLSRDLSFAILPHFHLSFWD